MLYTDLDFRVKQNTKVIQIGIAVNSSSANNSGAYIVYLENTEDAFTQFVLQIEKKVHEFVLVTAAPVVDGKVGVSVSMAFRAKDIACVQLLENPNNGAK